MTTTKNDSQPTAFVLCYTEYEEYDHQPQQVMVRVVLDKTEADHWVDAGRDFGRNAYYAELALGAATPLLAAQTDLVGREDAALADLRQALTHPLRCSQCGEIKVDVVKREDPFVAEGITEGDPHYLACDKCHEIRRDEV